MDFLNNAFSQLSDLFRSMTPGARITAALLLLLVVISLAYLVTHQMSGTDVFLLNGEPIPAGHLAEMEAAFAAAGLDGYEVVGSRIRVPRHQKAAYMGALADAKALPPNFGKALDDALESSSAFISKHEREQRLKIAKQKELALIISSMSGIERATVLYDTETKGGLVREKETTATACVKPAGNQQLSESQVSAIRYVVAGAIAWLKPANVTVSDLNGRAWYADPDSGTDPMSDPYHARKRMYEQEWKAKILDALTYVPGVNVTANVMLDKEQSRRSESVDHKPKGFTVRSEEKTASRTQDGAAPAGRPGLAANQPTALPATRTKGPHEDEETSESSILTVPSTERVVKEAVGLTPQRVSVSVAIPSSYFEQVWKERNPAEEGQEPRSPEKNELDSIREEETTSIREFVANLLPEVTGVQDRTSLVKVTTFQDITPPEIPPPGMGENAVAWLGRHWGTLGMVGLTLFSLVMLRSMIRAAPQPPDAESSPTILPGGEATDAETAAAAAKRLSRFSGGGRSLRDELAELVQEDPDAAANILKTWISSVG